jgi:hypothetical protein
MESQGADMGADGASHSPPVAANTGAVSAALTATTLTSTHTINSDLVASISSDSAFAASDSRKDQADGNAVTTGASMDGTKTLAIQ